MVKTQTIKFAKCLIIFSCLSMAACSDDGTTTIPELEPVTEVKVMDKANEGNASDIFVVFDAEENDPAVAYQTYIGVSGAFSDIQLEDLLDLPAASYSSTSELAFFLDATQTDIVGEEIEEQTAYQVVVLSLGADGSAVQSVPSDLFELTQQSEVTTFIESLTANDALAIDNEGNLYASNFGTWSSTGGSGSHILKITPDGTVSNYATRLNGPLDLLYHSSGSLYVIDDNNGSRGNILKIDPVDGNGPLATINGWPSGLAEDTEGNVYVANYSSATLHKILPDGTIELVSSDSRLKGCVGIVYADDLLYLANYNDGRILRVDLSGAVSELTQLEVVPNFGLGYMTKLGEYLYTTGIGSNIIYRVSISTGASDKFAGTGAKSRLDGVVDYSTFFNPNGIVADEANNTLYILDYGKPAIRKIELK